VYARGHGNVLVHCWGQDENGRVLNRVYGRA
jgi:hypothetical protein